MLRFLLVSLCWGLVLAQDPDLDQICPPGEEFWPHQECEKYYICNNGLPIVGDCPSGLFWHQAISACDFPNQVPECQGGTRPPVDNTTIAPPTTTMVPITNATVPVTTPVPATNATVPTTNATVPVTTPVPTTNATVPTTNATIPVTTPVPSTNATIPTTNATIPMTTPVPTTNATVPTTNATVPTTNATIPMTTPLPSTNATVPATNATAPTTNATVPATTPLPTTPSPTECPPTGTAQIPYPGDCSLYRLCDGGTVAGIYRCHPGTLFDTVARECLPEAVAVCQVESIVLIADQLQEKMDAGQETDKSFMPLHHQWTDADLKELGKIWAPFRLD